MVFVFLFLTSFSMITPQSIHVAVDRFLITIIILFHSLGKYMDDTDIEQCFEAI